MHQHCNGHRPYSARNRCDRRRMRRNLIISDIPAQLVVLIAVNSHIDDNRPFFDVICRDKLRLSDCNDQDIRRVLMQLINGTYSPQDPELFRPLYNSLLNTQDTAKADTYFILADFKSYAEAQRRVEAAYKDEKNWAKSALLNVACAGKFSSDRTIEEYERDIWHQEKVILPSKPELSK